MARWRLTAPHYLQTEGNQYEHKEIDAETGVQARVMMEVPILLDPNVPANSHRPPNQGRDYIVCHKGKGERRDIVLIGDPTPDMEPLDDEAKGISEALAPGWKHPIDSIGNEDYGNVVMSRLENQMSQLLSKIGASAVAQPAGVSVDDFRAWQEQVAALMAKNAQLEEQLAAAPKRRL